MPIPSPFHERTQPLCSSYRWKDWAGYCAVSSYDTSHEREYFAFRESAGLLDVTPLYKYEVSGPDAAALLARMMVRDMSKLKVGRVGYTCWCDDDGKVLDDGTVSRLGENHFRVTAADPTLHWLQALSRGFDVTIEDSSTRLAALALQGPTSRAILRDAVDPMVGAGSSPIDALKFFGVTRSAISGIPVWISRTGYTGDLGYEVWVEREQALGVWDALMAAGQSHGIEPAGLDALDVVRIEAGFILLGVDYYSSHKVVLESRKSTPLELGFGWMVDLERGNFIGRDAIAAEMKRGPIWQLVGLEVSWEELEALYAGFNLPPSLPATARRDALPIYDEDGRQVGQATSHTWSPLLKKYLAIASVRRGAEAKGTKLQIEHTVEYERRKVTATVAPIPFYDPERKRKP
ncbi:MAG TPA: aminomethyltransferase family protein [Thermoanaerobaculia bacterium]|nr:aminomethyltransferase family protein [Thermoanaerobaculia bacterium]